MKRLLVTVLCLGLVLCMAVPGSCTNGSNPFQLTLNIKLNIDPAWLPFSLAVLWVNITDGANKYNNYNIISFISTGPNSYKLVLEILGYSKFGQDFPIPKNGVRLYYNAYLTLNPVGMNFAGDYKVDTGTQTVYATPGGNSTADITINYPSGASRTVVPKGP